MKEMLVVRIGHNLQDVVHWMIWSNHDSQIIASGELAQGKLSVLEEKAADREVIVLLPSDQVSLKTVMLPTKWGRKLEQALPYLIEEQLAQDVDSMFIAIEQPTMVDEKHAIRIACCDKTWLSNWYSRFHEAGIEIHRMVPDALLLPNAQDGEASMIRLGEQWLVKQGDWQVAAVESSWLETYLHAAKVSIVNHFSPIEHAFAGIQWNAQEAEYDLPLAVCAKHLTLHKLTFNQGAFAQKKKQPQWWADWRSGLIAASVALVAFIGVKTVQLIHLNNDVANLKAEAVAAYQEAFPGKVVRPQLLRTQLRSALAQLDGGPETSFLKLTEQMVTVLSEVKQFSVETIRFDQRRNELRIRARGKDFQSFGQVKALFEQQGLSVDQGSLNNDGDFVVGELRVKGA